MQFRPGGPGDLSPGFGGWSWYYVVRFLFEDSSPYGAAAKDHMVPICMQQIVSPLETRKHAAWLMATMQVMISSADKEAMGRLAKVLEQSSKKMPVVEDKIASGGASSSKKK